MLKLNAFSFADTSISLRLPISRVNWAWSVQVSIFRLADGIGIGIDNTFRMLVPEYCPLAKMFFFNLATKPLRRVWTAEFGRQIELGKRALPITGSDPRKPGAGEVDEERFGHDRWF
ncbi:MAG TPA: hypothetical protein VGI40_16300 [Pirellulaceae bacterium]|jgi:hypothetical protein